MCFWSTGVFCLHMKDWFIFLWGVFYVRVSPCCPSWSWRYSCRMLLCRWFLNIPEKQMIARQSGVCCNMQKAFAVLLRNVRIFMTSETPVWWVDKCLEGFPQASNQQLCQIVSEQSSLQEYLLTLLLSVFSLKTLVMGLRISCKEVTTASIHQRRKSGEENCSFLFF